MEPDPRQQAARNVRAAIVGAGLMGRWHAHELTHAGGTLMAIADTDRPAAERPAHAYRARAFSSLDDLLAAGELDVLHICTPPNTHVELAERALAAGVHVIIEKPLAPDLAATERLLALAQATRRLLIPVHQFTFQRGVKTALKRLPQIAPLIHLDVTVATAGGGKDGAALDSLIFEIAPHALALCYHFLSHGLDGITWGVRHPAPGELRALGQAETISVALNLSTRARPTRNRLTIVGEHGSFAADLFHGFAVFQSGEVSRTLKIFQPFTESTNTFAAASLNMMVRALLNEPAYPGLRGLIRAFYDSIRTGAPAPISPTEIQAIARARDELISLSQLNSNA